MTWESYLFDDLGMTGHTAEHDFGTVHNVAYLNSGSNHPINAGLAGTRQVAHNYGDGRYGRPSSGATVVASFYNANHLPAIFAYDKGRHMVGMDAPGKRIGWHFADHTAAGLTSAGWKYFSQAVAWATGCGVHGIVAKPVNLHASPQPQGVELEWVSETNEEDERYILEKLEETGEWSIIRVVELASLPTGTASFSHVDEEPTIGVNIYRVRLESRAQERQSEQKAVDYLSSANVSIYPNPTSEWLKVDLTGFEGFEVTLTMADRLGRVVMARTIAEATDEAIELDVRQLTPGMYIVHAQANAAKKAMPVVVIGN